MCNKCCLHSVRCLKIRIILILTGQYVWHVTKLAKISKNPPPPRIPSNDAFLSHYLKGKFSSGIEGTLASTLNHDFNWKQLSEIILCIFLLMFSKFIWVTLIQKQQKYSLNKTRLWSLGVGVAFYYDLKYNR